MIIRNIIGKYALILAAFSVVTTAVQYVMSNAVFSDELVANSLIQMYTPIAFSLLFNLVTALIVQQDIRKHTVKTKYIMVATILYRPVGVFAFLLFLIFQDKFNKKNV
jgi:hypothetical protein